MVVVNLSRKESFGSLLIGELASLVVLSISIIGLTQLTSSSGASSNHLTYLNKAHWMAEDIFMRMSLRQTYRLANSYNNTHSSITCPGPSDPFDTEIRIRDLQMVFCSPNQADPTSIFIYAGSAGFIPDLQWSLSCPTVSGEWCPTGQTVRIEISWPDNTSQNSVNGRFTFVSEKVI